MWIIMGEGGKPEIGEFGQEMAIKYGVHEY